MKINLLKFQTIINTLTIYKIYKKMKIKKIPGLLIWVIFLNYSVFVNVEIRTVLISCSIKKCWNVRCCLNCLKVLCHCNLCQLLQLFRVLHLTTSLNNVLEIIFERVLQLNYLLNLLCTLICNGYSTRANLKHTYLSA